MRRTLLIAAALEVLFLLCGPAVGATRLAAQEPAADTTAVLNAARAVLEGITTGDTALIRSVTAPDLRLEGTSAGGSLPPTAAGQTRGELLAMVAGSDESFVERMWTPTARLHGRTADVLAPYDFYRDGEFSHCGIDLFQLVETAGGWQVVSLIWTVEQPPACQRHPEGPPADADDGS